MTIRVIQWATGTVGIHAVPAIVNHPDLELAGLWVHSDSKVGRDAGELCGIDPVGITATRDFDSLLEVNADAVCYTANSDLRPDGVVDDLCRLLESGLNVVNTSFVPLLYPPAAGDGVAERLQAAAVAGNSSLYTSGIDPGFGNTGLAIHAMALCKEVQSVRMMEIVNYATWDNPATLFDIMGFGKSDPSEALLLAGGSLVLGWGPVVELVAHAIGLKLDGVIERFEVTHADEPFEISSGKIPEGGISAIRFEVVGVAGGEERVMVEHVTRMRDHDCPDWPRGSGYRVIIEGEPHAELEYSVSSDVGDHNHAGCLATAMAVINAIPSVVAAEPGVQTLLDLPVYTAKVS